MYRRLKFQVDPHGKIRAMCLSTNLSKKQFAASMPSIVVGLRSESMGMQRLLDLSTPNQEIKYPA